MIFLILLPYLVTGSHAIPEDSLLINRLTNGQLGYSGYHQPKFIEVTTPLPIYETKSSNSYGISEITKHSEVKELNDVGKFGSLDEPEVNIGGNIIREGIAGIFGEPIHHQNHNHLNEPCHSMHHFDGLQHHKHHLNWIIPEVVDKKRISEEAALNIKSNHEVSVGKQHGIVDESSAFVDEATKTHAVLNSDSDRGVANIHIFLSTYPRFVQAEPSFSYYQPSPVETLGKFALEQFLSEPDVENQYGTGKNYQNQDESYFVEQYPGIFDDQQDYANHQESLDFAGGKLNNQLFSGISPSIQTAQFQSEGSVPEEFSVAEEQRNFLQSSLLGEQFNLMMLDLINQYKHYQQFGWTVPYVYQLAVPVTSDTTEAEVAPTGLLGGLSAEFSSVHKEEDSVNSGSVKELEVEHHYSHHHEYHHHEEPHRSKEIILFSRFGEDKNEAGYNSSEHTPKPDIILHTDVVKNRTDDGYHKENDEEHHKIDSTYIKNSISKSNESELVTLESSKSTVKITQSAAPEEEKHQEHSDGHQTVAKEADEHRKHDLNDTKDSTLQFEGSTLPTLYLSKLNNNTLHPEVPEVSVHSEKEQGKLIVNDTKQSESPVVDLTPWTQSDTTSENEISSGVETLVKRTTFVEDPRVVTLTIKLPPKTITKEVEVTKTADGHENVNLEKEHEVSREVGGPILVSVNDSQHSDEHQGEKVINAGSLEKILNLIPQQ